MSTLFFIVTYFKRHFKHFSRVRRETHSGSLDFTLCDSFEAASLLSTSQVWRSRGGTASKLALQIREAINQGQRSPSSSLFPCSWLEQNPHSAGATAEC